MLQARGGGYRTFEETKDFKVPIWSRHLPLRETEAEAQADLDTWDSKGKLVEVEGVKTGITCPYCDHEFIVDVDPTDFSRNGELEQEEVCVQCRKAFAVEYDLSIDVVDEYAYEPEPEPEPAPEDEDPE